MAQRITDCETKIVRFALALLTLLVPVASGAHAGTATGADYGLDMSQQTDTVYFQSSAKLEFIEGSTQHIEGGFNFDPANPGFGNKGVLRVDLRQLQTGIEKRDEHMRNRQLQTDKFPYAFFEFKQIITMPGPLRAGNTYSGKVSGFFYIHGVKRELTADLEFSILEDSSGAQSISARVKFSLLLDDYRIKRPKALFLKLAREIEVELVFFAYRSHPSASIQLPDWHEVR